MSSPKIENLEYLVMDLGTELYQLKAELSYMKHKQQTYEKAMGDLYTILLTKNILEEKEWIFNFPIVELEELKESGTELEQNSVKPYPTKKDYH